MIKVGAFEAKTHLSSLLDKVAQGEDILITRRGLPVARLVPARQAERAGTQSVIDELRALRTGMKLDGLDWKELRDNGRR
ncbi:MAG: type II toxin-antitoxin system prevent-host-death family antitoxin [Thiotrichales bacterium]|nr:type II toxin-antitoxin system prevent-host-death family antitoxin [Thiotrichales bacterium]